MNTDDTRARRFGTRAATVVAVAVAAATLWQLTANRAEHADTHPVMHDAQNLAQPGVGKRSSSAGSRSAPSEPNARATVRHPFPQLPRTRKRLPLLDDPFTATSIAEQDWLDRNGYPNALQWRALPGASDAQLAEAAAAGDRVAKTLLDQRRLLAGDDTAIDAMLEDGARGSTFALELLSSTIASRRLNDPVMAYALSRLVELRGNSRVATGRDVMLRQPLTAMERLEGEREALRLFQQVRQIQISRFGGGRPATDPRPVEPNEG